MKQTENGRARSVSADPANYIRVKRSVSPDGRIDSLSVEVVSPLESVDHDEITRCAREIVRAQENVVEAFLGSTDTDVPQNANGNGVDARPAQITAIGGMDTEWGRRLFLVFQVGSETTRVFGSPRKLARVLDSAGAPLEEAEIGEGLDIDVPCQVVTGRTEDNRFLTIEKVYAGAAS